MSLHKWPQRVFVEDTQGLQAGSLVNIKGELYDVLDVQPIDNSITVQPIQAKQQQETSYMKTSLLGQLLSAMAVMYGERSEVIESPRSAGKSNAMRKRKVLGKGTEAWPKPRNRPHSRRNKVGSHKQTMRKLGKL